MRKFALSLAAAALVGTVGAAQTVQAAGDTPIPPRLDWSYTGWFGTYDRSALQRGLQVYEQVCASCHGLDLMYYRNLTEIGYSKEEVHAYASQFSVTDGPDDTGEMFERPGKPSDPFKAPYRNDKEAAYINGGAVPPDLSLIVKSRAHGAGEIPVVPENFLDALIARGHASGGDYLVALMKGYRDSPTPEEVKHCKPAATDKDVAEFTIPPGKYFNIWFPGCLISMPPPLFADAVEYADGTEATVDQMAHDVSEFLAWTAEPKLEERKQTGMKVLLFLAFFTGIMIAVKRNIWAGVKKKK